jgi:signal transduction histidine kinase
MRREPRASTIDSVSRPRAAGTFAHDLQIATAAHDLRNRLGVAGCEIQELRSQLPHQLDASGAAIAEALESVERSLAHTNALLEDLLERACGQSCVQVTCDPHSVDLVQLAKRMFVSQHCASSTHRMSFVPVVPRLVGAWDEARLRHLLWNLLTNALQYTPAGGEVVVTLDRQVDEAVLRIADTGIGIPADDLPHVFEPFFRARNAEVVAPGLGLGLATARLVVEQYGGALEVESVERTGTMFTVRLPVLAT